jgi:hypothetical protein
VIFAEPRRKNLASFVPCFLIEGGGFRLSAFTVLPVEVACMAESAWWFMREDSGKIKRCQ